MNLCSYHRIQICRSSEVLERPRIQKHGDGVIRWSGMGVCPWWIWWQIETGGHMIPPLKTR
jgi:hypothetical protein